MPGTVPAIGDLIQVRVQCVQGPQLSMNVLHYRVTSIVGGGLTLLEMGNALNGLWSPVYRPWMPVDATYRGVLVQNLQPPKTDSVEAATSLAGTAIGAGMAKQVSGLITYRTGFGGRANRGRSYIGFGSSTWMQAGGELSGAGLAILTALGVQLGPIIAPTFGGKQTALHLVIRHPDAGGPPPVPQSTDVATVQAEQLLATQRRRGDFGRPNIIG